MIDLRDLGEAYRGRRVLLTGHTGFKGGWLAIWLAKLGARVVGLGLPPPDGPSLFSSASVADKIIHVEGDIRDVELLEKVWCDTKPEIVFHLAAQSLVRESYLNPLDTIQTNVIGVANILDLARKGRSPLAMVIVTSDKCYENCEWVYGYRETDRLGGYDAYSASKAAAEILIESYRRSFFSSESLSEHRIAVASVRAGNVIGGGDWAIDRIVPDCIRALTSGRPIRIRQLNAIRPWQHVLEPLSGYLALGARLLSQYPSDRASFCEAWNFGPEPSSIRSVQDLVEAIVDRWGAGYWEADHDTTGFHEASILRLSIDKAQSRLGWCPKWSFGKAVISTIDWYKAFLSNCDMARECENQITEYMETG